MPEFSPGYLQEKDTWPTVKTAKMLPSVHTLWNKLCDQDLKLLLKCSSGAFYSNSVGRKGEQAKCPICLNHSYPEDWMHTDGAMHTSRLCKHPTIHLMRMSLHNELVDMVHQALRHTAHGGCHSFADTKDNTVQAQSRAEHDPEMEATLPKLPRDLPDLDNTLSSDSDDDAGTTGPARNSTQPPPAPPASAPQPTATQPSLLSAFQQGTLFWFKENDLYPGHAGGLIPLHSTAQDKLIFKTTSNDSVTINTHLTYNHVVNVLKATIHEPHNPQETTPASTAGRHHNTSRTIPAWLHPSTQLNPDGLLLKGLLKQGSPQHTPLPLHTAQQKSSTTVTLWDVKVAVDTHGRLVDTDSELQNKYYHLLEELSDKGWRG